MSTLQRRPFHSFLVAGYAVLALLAYNIDQVKVSNALRSLLICLALAGILWGLLRLVIKDWRRSALAATLLLALFFAYGHVYAYLRLHPLFGIDFGRHRWLLPLWIAIAAAGIWWTVSKKRDLSTITAWLNVSLLVALVFPLVQIASFELRSLSAESTTVDLPQELENLHLPDGQTPPDVYLIILDGYGRQDILYGTFHYDNTPFIDSLRDMGFYVAECSMSNYAQTELSLTSMLNLNYLETLGEFPADSADRTPLRPFFKHSVVRQALEHLGYQTVAFDSDFYRTQLTDVDIYLSKSTEGVGGINGFETLLIKTSAGLLFTDAAYILPRFLTTDIDRLENERRRSQVLYVLEKLPEISTTIPGPKFVFTHIVSPHDPYVFDAQGDAVDYDLPLSPEEQVVGYREQLIFVNSQIVPVLQQILDRSTTPPIIILMGDHGPGWASNEGRMLNLNALLFPGDGAQYLYSTITPVNTFRLIFNINFGGEFDLLEDFSFFSMYQQPFDFQLIPNACKE